MDAGVVPVCLNVMDRVVVDELRPSTRNHRHLLDRPSLPRVHPLLPRGHPRALACALDDALDHAREPVGVDRLQEVVERLDREGVDRVLRVRGHEHDRRRVALLAHERRRVQAAGSRHLNVEEHDVVVQRLRESERLGGTRGLADDLDSAMTVEQVAELRPRRRLVVDEQRAHGHAGTSSRTIVPNGNDRSLTPSP